MQEAVTLGTPHQPAQLGEFLRNRGGGKPAPRVVMSHHHSARFPAHTSRLLKGSSMSETSCQQSISLDKVPATFLPPSLFFNSFEHGMIIAIRDDGFCLELDTDRLGERAGFFEH
jgi:hypothetical protein